MKTVSEAFSGLPIRAKMVRGASHFTWNVGRNWPLPVLQKRWIPSNIRS